MRGWGKIVCLSELCKINLVGRVLPHEPSVWVSDFVVFGYGINIFAVKVSLFGETKDFTITIINSFSSIILQFPHVFVLSVLPVICHQVQLLFRLVIKWVAECVRRINNTVFDIEWLQFVSVVGGVSLQRISECCSEHVIATSGVLGDTNWMEWRQFLDF